MDRAKVAAVTGCHAFEVPAFYALLRSVPQIEFYPQHMDNFVADFGQARQGYDAVVFYNYHQHLATDDGRMQRALEKLGENEQGIVVWHHGLVAFLDWPHWSSLCGIPDRAFTAHKGQSIRVKVADPKHPITRELAAGGAWEMEDETYAMASAGEDSHCLLTAQHPRSLRTLAWTRSHGKARVFCYQSGHGRQAYACPQFRSVFARGVLWTAHRL